jgi:hypothetical protein
MDVDARDVRSEGGFIVGGFVVGGFVVGGVVVGGFVDCDIEDEGPAGREEDGPAARIRL